MPSIPTLIHRILACGLLALCGTSVQADSRGVIFTPPIHTLIASLEGDFAGLPGQDDPRFGFSVALHGDTLAVGAPGTLTGSGDNIYRRGAVFLYRRQQEGHGWQFLQRIAFGVGGDGQCGHAVALSDSFLMVGCPWHQVSGVARGRAVILARDGGTGLYGDAVNLVGDSTGAACGHSVAIIDSAPGTDSPLPMAAMGCPDRTFPTGGGFGTNTGAVEVFTWLLGWSHATTLAPAALPGNNSARFGQSVLLNRTGPAPGMTLLLGVGVPGQDMVRMYAMGGTVQTWNLERSIDGPDNSRFGHSLHMRGGRLAIGAPERAVPNGTLMPPVPVPSGSLGITTRSCNFQGVCGWSQNVTELLAIPTMPVLAIQNRLGESVHVLTPERIVAGSPLFPYPTFHGQVRHYLLDEGDWERHDAEPFDPLAATLPTSESGHAVAGDAAWLAVGLPGSPDGWGRVNVYAWDYDDVIFSDDFECSGPVPGCI